jgi:hypothetical protein
VMTVEMSTMLAGISRLAIADHPPAVWDQEWS